MATSYEVQVWDEDEEYGSGWFTIGTYPTLAQAEREVKWGQASWERIRIVPRKSPRKGAARRDPMFKTSGRLLVTPYQTGRNLRVAILEGEDGFGDSVFEEVRIYPEGGIVSARPRVIYRSMPEARRAIDAIYRRYK